MTVTLSVKQLLEGVMLQQYSLFLAEIQDLIEVLSEQKIVTTLERTVVRKIGLDDNEMTQKDQYGDYDAAGSANYVDRTYLKDTYDMPEPYTIDFIIPKSRWVNFGITEAMLQLDNSILTESQILAFTDGIKEEFGKLIRKGKQFRNNQVRFLLTNLETSALAWQTPYGFAPVDIAANRTTAFSYTNEFSAALTTAQYKLAVNLFASDQKDGYNNPSPISTPLMLLHASNFSLAEEIHLPAQSVNTLYRTAGDTLLEQTQNVKSVGVYGDTVSTADWVLLGKNHQIYRKTMVDAFGRPTNGVSFGIKITDNGSLKIWMDDESIMVCDSPEDILKAVI